MRSVIFYPWNSILNDLEFLETRSLRNLLLNLLKKPVLNLNQLIVGVFTAMLKISIKRVCQGFRLNQLKCGRTTLVWYNSYIPCVGSFNALS